MTEASRRPRLLVTLHSPDISGPLRTLEPRIALLADRGVDVFVTVPALGAASRSLARWATISLTGPYERTVLPSSIREANRTVVGIGRDLMSFRKLMRTLRPSLVLAVTAVLPSVVLAARARGIPCVVYAAEVLGGERGRIATHLYARAARRIATHVVCASSTVAASYGWPRVPDVSVVHPGVTVRPSSADRTQLRRRLGIPAGAFCMGSVGTLAPGRGQAVVLDALAQLVVDVPDVHCIIVGAPDRRTAAHASVLRSRAAEPALAGRVTFLRSVNEISDLYGAVDVVVNPALVPEGFGRVACEALLHGLPVVSTNVGAVPSLLVDQRHALLVKPGDASAIAGAVRTIIGSPQFTAQLVQEGRHHVRHLTDPRTTDRAFLRIIQNLLGP